MTLGNMRHPGVHHLVATCLNDACRHQGLIDVSKYPDDVEVPSFASKIVCAKCDGFDAIDAGPLSTSRYLEPMAMVWIKLAIAQKMGRDFGFAILRR
jgi:predicted dinucleotide-binding enzyme